MKTLLHTLLTLSILNSSFAFADGGRDVGNGGDMDALEFVGIAKNILNHWSELEFTQDGTVTKEAFSNAVNTAEVHSTPEILKVRGFEVDAKNYPFCVDGFLPKPDFCGVILLNEDRWKKSEADQVKRVALVFHEFLGVLGKNQVRFDDYYQVSAQKFAQVKAFFDTQMKINLHFACFLSAWSEAKQEVEVIRVIDIDEFASTTWFKIGHQEFEIETKPTYDDLFSKTLTRNLLYSLLPKARGELADRNHPLSSGLIEFKSSKTITRISNKPELNLSCYRTFEGLKY